MAERAFMIRFTLNQDNIATEIKQQNVSPQEAIGLLEMAKSQILDNLAKGRKEIFSTTKRNE